MSERPEPSGWAIGWTFFAAFMMMLVGGFQIIAGLAAILNGDRFGDAVDHLLEFDATQWGWVHLLFGVLILLAGLGLFKGAVWARMVGVIMAGLTALSAFAVIPIHPVWGIMIAAVAIAVIWALTAHGRDVADL
jgi:hypothetical protein